MKQGLVGQARHETPGPARPDPALPGQVAPAAARWVLATALAGACTGLIAGGIGGRLAMLALRVTSAESVRGMVSDDGFVIGRVTLGGTFSLLAVGAAFGVLGGFVHRLVAPWLIGPGWFRRLTTATGCGVVVGAIIIHPDGVDFTALTPHWFAVALFVAVPALYGALIGPVQDHFDRSGSWINRGRFRRLVPALFLGPIVVPAAVVCGFAFLVRSAWLQAHGTIPIGQLPGNSALRVLARVPWVAIVALGLVNLVDDIAVIV
jgi:hypothetical protein